MAAVVAEKDGEKTHGSHDVTGLSWSATHSDWKEEILHNEAYQAIEAKDDSRNAEIQLLCEVFKNVDLDNNGSLDVEEFGEVLKMLDPDIWTDDQIQALFDAADEDKNGSLDIHELLHFMLGVDADMLDEEYDDHHDDVHDEDHDDCCMRKTLSRRISAGAKPKYHRNEEHLITADQMYEVLTSRDGHIGGRLILEDFIELWVDARTMGLDLDLRQIPQSIEEKVVGEVIDITGLQLAHLCQLLKDNPEASTEDARAVADNTDLELCILTADSRPAQQMKERLDEIKDRGIPLDLPISQKCFKRLLDIISELMQIDLAVILTVFTWVKMSRFDMTESIAATVVSSVFMKTPAAGNHVLDTHISQNDFARICTTMELVDNSEKHGLAHGKIAIFFSNVLRNLPTMRHQRDERVHQHKHDGHGKKRNASTKSRKHLTLIGRTQLSILFEELYKAIPNSRNTYGSPLKFVISCIMKASSAEIERERTSMTMSMSLGATESMKSHGLAVPQAHASDKPGSSSGHRTKSPRHAEPSRSKSVKVLHSENKAESEKHGGKDMSLTKAKSEKQIRNVNH